MVFVLFSLQNFGTKQRINPFTSLLKIALKQQVINTAKTLKLGLLEICAFKTPRNAAFECSKTSITSKSCSNNTSEMHLLVGLCLAQLLSAVLNNAHVRYTGTFLPVSSILKFRCCFAASCLHIANVICDSFLYVLQLVVEVKCMTRFLPLFLTCLFPL